MCNQREHRYRISMILGHLKKEQDLVVYAKGISEALAQADGWAAIHFPEESCIFSIFRTGYSDPSMAHEHGAILPESFFPSNA